MIPRRLAKAACLLELACLPLTALADGTGSQLSLPGEIGTSNRANEYVSGNYPGAVLMPVNLWGAVQKPGIHHVPTETDVLRLLSFAGGPAKEAELELMTIKRTNKEQDKVIDIDLGKLLTRPGQGPRIALEPNDIIYVAPKEDAVSSNTLKTVAVISSVVGIVLSAVLIRDSLRRP